MRSVVYKDGALIWKLNISISLKFTFSFPSSDAEKENRNSEVRSPRMVCLTKHAGLFFCCCFGTFPLLWCNLAAVCCSFNKLFPPFFLQAEA